MSKSKQKGTGGETELLRRLAIPGLRRTPASSKHDLEVDGPDCVYALATRPDRGRWLITIDVDSFLRLYGGQALKIEVKRYRKFRHHTIWEEKFGGRVGR